MLGRTGGIAGLLALGLSDWLEQLGLGPAKAGRLWATQELTRRAQRTAERPRITSPGRQGPTES